MTVVLKISEYLKLNTKPLNMKNISTNRYVRFNIGVKNSTNEPISEKR